MRKAQINIINFVVGIIFLFLLVLGGYFVYRIFYGPSGEEIVVPNIVGYDLYDARNNLKLIGLDLEVVSFSFSDKPENMILNQFPSPGVKVKKGRIIKVVISKGSNIKKDIFLPNLVDYNLYDITINPKFKQLKLSYDYLYYLSSSFKDGTILMQFPEPESKISNNQNISLLIAKKIDNEKLLNNLSQSLDDSWDNLDKIDNIFIEFKKSDIVQDRAITNAYIYSDTLIVESNLNYSQIPNLKIVSLVLKLKYSKGINNVKVYLEDFLGRRLVMDGYYTGQSFFNLRLSYLGDAKVNVYLNNKKVADYSLP